MATRESRENISMPLLQIKYIKCTERIPGLLVAIAGLLTSLWANCILVVICLQDDYYSYQTQQKYISRQIILSFQLTHLVIVLTVTAGLFLGLKEKNRSLLPSWLVIKGLEVGCLFVGSILLIVGRQMYIGILPLALIFLLIGAYIFLCVWDTYKKMELPRTASPDNVSIDLDDENVLPKDPPSYDSFINQANTRN